MSTKNLIKKENKFAKPYIASIVSNDDPLRRGRLKVKIPAIMGSIPFWVNSTLTAGAVRLLLIPEPGDVVSVSFRNKDIYSGEWKLEGCPNNEAAIDPKKYGLSDNQGNFIIIDRATNSISIKATDAFNVTSTGPANIKSSSTMTLETTELSVKAPKTILGTGGKSIARLGDEVTVEVPGHGSCKGTITTAGVNTSI